MQHAGGACTVNDVLAEAMMNLSEAVDTYKVYLPCNCP